MRLISKLALTGAGLVAAAGTAVAAEDAMKVMQVRLDDGSVVHIRYAGDRKPQVAVVPADKAAPSRVVMADPVAARFAAMNAMFADMDRQMAALQREAAEMRRQGVAVDAQGRPMTVVSTRALPAGTVRYSVVTTRNGNCTRTVETRYAAGGEAPIVVERTAGDCSATPSAKPAPAQKPTPAAPPRTVTRNDA